MPGLVRKASLFSVILLMLLLTVQPVSAQDTSGTQTQQPDATGTQAQQPDASGTQAPQPDANGTQAQQPDANGAQTQQPEVPSQWDAALQRVPDADKALVASALDLAGANASAISNVLLSVPDAWLPGAVFLTINMPIEDLTVVSEEVFLDGLRDAYQARAEFPWAGQVSESDFLRYVLPMRVSQEPLEDWRGFFMEQLRTRVASLQTLDEAALEVNRWCGERVGFQQTQRRDQGPFETLSSGYGRCEEMMIVYIDACRSVGIPARQAWTPYWGFQDNNHAWAEVLGNDGNWHYVGACEPSDRLDDAWFNQAVKRANLVFSVPFGLPESGTEEVYKLQDIPGARYAILDSTSFYRPSTVLTVNVVDLQGNPLPETSVYLSVFNFGALRPIAKGVTNEEGKWTITVGPGGYFVSAGDEIRGACIPLDVAEPGELEMSMTIGLGAELPPGTFWLRYPVPEEAEQ